MTTKTIKFQDLINLYDNKSDKKKEKILWEALDYMRQYNGRNRWDCIALVLGYREIEE